MLCILSIFSRILDIGSQSDWQTINHSPVEEKTEEDIMETVKGLLEKIVSITTSFDTYRIGKANVDKIRPIIVKFENEIVKEQVLCKKWNLKNMTGCEKIFVREDMTWKQRETLMDLIREARERTAERENECVRVQNYFF